MYAFGSLAFGSLALLLPLAASTPQYMFPGDTACYWKVSYTTTSTADATEKVGDHGWQNYDGNTCTAGGSDCSLTEGRTVSKTITINFNGGPTFELADAVKAGLTFGVSVAYTDAKSQTTSENCVASGDDNKPCVCGLQFKTTMQEAKGTSSGSDGCGNKSRAKPFDVTSPVLIDGKARTQWRSCRAAASQCSQMAQSPACADGL